MKQLRIFPPTFRERGSDAQGNGAFGAPRGSRKHVGRDYAVKPGGNVSCPVEGRVSRIGQCYADDPTFKLVEIHHDRGFVRVLYVDPCVSPGDDVMPGQTIGLAQDLTSRYPGITNHVHMDLRLVHGVLCGRDGTAPTDALYVDPALFVF